MPKTKFEELREAAPNRFTFEPASDGIRDTRTGLLYSTAQEALVAVMNESPVPDPIDVRTVAHGHAQAADDFPIFPFDDVVYVEQIVEEVTEGGIIVPGDANKMSLGKVVAVGPGRIYGAAMNASGTMETAIFMPSRLKVGDIVVWGRYRTGGEAMELNGKRYVACREGDLGGVVREGYTVNARIVTDAS